MIILILLRKPLQSLLKLVLPIYLSRISPVRQEKGRYHVINTVNFIVASSFDPRKDFSSAFNQPLQPG